jgi:ABC-type uncharacterized transport system auxiliary subunit
VFARSLLCRKQALSQERPQLRPGARESVHEFIEAASLELGSNQATRGPPGSEITWPEGIDMKKYLKALAFTLAVLAALTGCAGKIRYPSYYTLNLPPAPDPAPEENVRASIAVREFQSPAYLRQGPVVYRRTPEEIGFYEYHRWASDPRVQVTNAVIDHLRAGGHFSAVSTYDGRSNADYIFSGRLEKLEEVDYDGGVKVEVAISAKITRVARGATVWSNTVSEAATVPQRNVPGVVSQMNKSMDLAINKLLASIPASLASSK